MSFNQGLNQVLEQLLLKPSEIITNQQLIQCIDLTLLSEVVSKHSLETLNYQATQHSVAAICVFPRDLIHIKPQFKTRLATVVNFPQGTQDSAECVPDINRALTHGAHEIDYVFPYSLYLTGQKQKAIQQAREIICYCKERQVTLKIILETGAFSDLDILYELALELIDINIDFLKTSTGKIAQGASFAAVFTLLNAIKDSKQTCGIKISGGIKTPEQAKCYAYLTQIMLGQPINKEWFRIGASGLLEELSSVDICRD